MSGLEEAGAALAAACVTGDREQAGSAVQQAATRNRPEKSARLVDRTARRDQGTMVICEACTSNGLNSPVRPCGSFAVTV